MSKVLFALVFVLFANMYMFLGQASISHINPGAVQFFNYETSTVAAYDAGNFTLEDNPIGRLPNQQGTISPTTGNLFTDGWAATKNWMYDVSGIDTLINIVNTVPNFLKAMHLPAEIAFIIGYVWYGFSIFVIVAFWKGFYL